MDIVPSIAAARLSWVELGGAVPPPVSFPAKSEKFSAPQNPLPQVAGI
jgi:hypothetical protein